MLVVPTGYMSSGSSAITDLISEFDGFSNVSGSQEFIFMHCPYGVLDLEKSLINPISHLISDEAIKRFRDMMSKLYYLEGWWPSYYKTTVSKNFMNYVDEYLDEITDYKFKGFWYMDEIPSKKPLSVKIKNRINGIKYLENTEMCLAFPTKEKFYSASKKFINKIIKDLNKENKKNIIIDQLLLPYDLDVLNNYFDNTKLIIVERDPRDVFVLNSKIDAKVPFPTKALEFAKFYRRLRELSDNRKQDNVLRVKFEDLIYSYDETLKIIYKFLGINESSHVLKKKFFKPEKSIDNTQIFLDYKNQDDIKIIEKELKEYLYKFPYVYDKKERDIF